MTTDPHSILCLRQMLGCDENGRSLAVANGGLVSVSRFVQMNLLIIL